MSSWFKTKGEGIVRSLVSIVVGGLLVGSDWVFVRGAHSEKSPLESERSSDFGVGGASSTGGGGTVGGEGVVSLGTGGRLSFGDLMEGGESAISAGVGGDFGKGGFGSSDGGGDLGNGGAGSAGGGGDEGSGGAGSPSEGRGGLLGDSSLKQTHLSPTSSPGFEESSGPKMLSRSVIEGLCKVSTSLCPSVSSVAADSIGGGEVGTFLGGSGGRASLVFCSSKAVSRGGPNKAVASSGTGDFLLLAGSGGGAGAGVGEGAGAGAGVGTGRLGRAISSPVFLFASPGLRFCDQQKGREKRHQRRGRQRYVANRSF